MLSILVFVFLQELSEDDYNKWLENHREAEVALKDRDQKLAESAELMEKQFELLGATGKELSCVLHKPCSPVT